MSVDISLPLSEPQFPVHKFRPLTQLIGDIALHAHTLPFPPHLALEVPLHPLCPLLFLRNKSGSLALKGKGVHQGVSTRKQTSLGDILEAAMPHPGLLNSKISVLNTTSSLLFRVKLHGFRWPLEPGTEGELGE